jgi:AcrR family transcriptional regulator
VPDHRPPGRGSVDPEAIQAAALALFAERGYRATTMADIGAALGIRGPSLYRHVESKQILLSRIMLATMHTLLADQEAALAAGGDVVVQLRRMVEAHVRFHARHREQAFVGNRRAVIELGCAQGRFNVPEPRLASYAILDMGIGVAAWFRADGPHGVEQVAYTYAGQATRMLS